MQNDLRNAILSMYSAIESARRAQIKTGHLDQGKRMGITSGKHFDELSSVIKNDLVSVGFKESEIYLSSNMCTLPGWYRPTKTWDILAFNNNKLVGAIELKSISSSFGNNINNRAEEAIGSAIDAIEASKNGLYGECEIPPVLGYVIIVKDSQESRKIISNINSNHFDIDKVFLKNSYIDRIVVLCERLRQKSIYNAVWLSLVNPDKMSICEPSQNLTYSKFIATMQYALKIHTA